VTRRRSFGWTTTGIDGHVDLRAGVDAFVDPRVAPLLGVPSVGAAVAAVQAGGGQVPDLHVTVEADLPGRIAWTGAGGASGQRQLGPGRVDVDVPMGQASAIAATARQRNWPNLILAGTCALSLFALVLVAVGRWFGITAAFRRDSWDYLSPRRRRR
jgi:hypothetical protein